MELRRYLEILAAYRWQLVLIPLVAAVLAFAATYVVAPRYVAVATVQLIPDEVEPSTVTLRTPGGPNSPAIGLRDPAELLVQNVIEGLGSQEVGQWIVNDLNVTPASPPVGLAALKQRVSEFARDVWTWLRYGYVAHQEDSSALASAVNSALSAQLVNGSYYVKISAVWNDPQMAARVANSSVQALLAQSRRLAATAASERTRFLETQMQSAQHGVESAREAMLQYMVDNRVAANESVRSAITALETARAAVRQNEVDLAGNRRRLTEIQTQLNSLVPETTTVQTYEGTGQPAAKAESRVFAQNPLYQSLRERIATLQQDIAALEVRHDQLEGSAQGENERALDETRRRLEVAQQQLKNTPSQWITVQSTEDNASPASSVARMSSPNLVYQTVQEQALSLQQDIAALETRQSYLEDQMRSREQDLRALTAQDTRLAALNQDLLSATEIYNRRVSLWSDARLEEARTVTQVRIIDAARPPLYPSYPIKIMWGLIGVVAGLVMVIGLIFVRHQMDLAVHSAEEAEAALQLALLSVVPTSGSGGGRARRGA